MAEDDAAIRRFYIEAQNTHSLHHPNTGTVSDFGRTDDGILYLVMEMVPGRSLSAVTKEEGRLGSARVVHIIEQVLKSLGEAHGTLRACGGEEGATAAPPPLEAQAEAQAGVEEHAGIQPLRRSVQLWFLLALLTFPASCSAATPSLRAHVDAVLREQATTEASQARCLQAYEQLAGSKDAGWEFLTEQVKAGAGDARWLAMWLLAEPRLRRPEGAALVADVAVAAWNEPMARCLAADSSDNTASSKRRCEGRLAGGRPPAHVRLACETLQRMGSAAGAERLAATGAHGYFLRGCMPLFIEHGHASDAVARSLVLESQLNPNGHQVLSGLADRGAAALPTLLRMLEVAVADAKLPAQSDDEFVCAPEHVLETVVERGTLAAVTAAVQPSQRSRLDKLARSLPAAPTAQELEDDAELSQDRAAAGCVARVTALLTPAGASAPAARPVAPPSKRPRRQGPWCPPPSSSGQ